MKAFPKITTSVLLLSSSGRGTFVVRNLHAMKRPIILFFIAWMGTHSLFAQNCNETTSRDAGAIQEACTDPENFNPQSYDSLKVLMFATFTRIENCVAQNPSYEARAKLQKINLYYSVSDLAGHIGRHDEALKFIEAMERLLPSPSGISASAATSFTVNGVNYTSDAGASYISSLYYQIIEQRVNYYYFGPRDYNQVIAWYDKIQNAPSDFKPQALEALLYADALYKMGKPRTDYFPAMAKAATAMGPLWAKKEVHDSSAINNRQLMLNWFYREINTYNKDALGSADPGGKYRMLAARGLWGVDDKPLAKEYALYAAQGGASDKADGFWYLDEVAGNEPVHVDAALQILERNVYQLSESEMDRLLPLARQYNRLALEEGIRSRQRRLANLRRRTRISLVPAVELVGLPCGHVPVSLNLRTGRIWQEFRFDYVWGAKSKYRFGRAFAKGDKGERYEFTGWDVGYTFQYIVGNDFKQGNRKGRSVFFAPALGFDLRYVNWNLAPIVSSVSDENGNVTESSVLINAKTNRYELCYRVGFITMTKFVTVDYYMGLGIGYRTLATAQGRSVEDEHFDDPRLAANRWNKLYMPLRLGVKIGFNLL